MRINYKRELESAAKSMILVHEPKVLIRIIVRMIVQKVGITHAAILLHEKADDNYILQVSRGIPGLCIPCGFARMDGSNALIRLFRDYPGTQVLSRGILLYNEAQKALLWRRVPPGLNDLLEEALYQLYLFEATACIPCFFRSELLGLVILGKKKRGGGLDRDEVDFLAALASDVAMAIRNAQLFRDLQEELDKKKRLFLNTTLALTAAIEAKDHYTHGHTTRVTGLSLSLAREYVRLRPQACDGNFFENLQIASLLHDIGKIGIPESILNKEGPLDAGERRRMQEHPLVGVDIIDSIQELKECVPGVKYHHERYDGNGYPEGLKAGQIPLMAAIISVADAFDAMVTDRPYRKSLSPEETMREIERQTGKQFDPQVTSVLFSLFRGNRLHRSTSSVL
ncbi:MAG: HD domain-containing protein [Candidatus Omnitrophica bacterium]|nr:HD domain-containing protein [Candidatus Omnitrophota bacterium]